MVSNVLDPGHTRHTGNSDGRLAVVRHGMMVFLLRELYRLEAPGSAALAGQVNKG